MTMLMKESSEDVYHSYSLVSDSYLQSRLFHQEGRLVVFVEQFTFNALPALLLHSTIIKMPFHYFILHHLFH